MGEMRCCEKLTVDIIREMRENWEREKETRLKRWVELNQRFHIELGLLDNGRLFEVSLVKNEEEPDGSVGQPSGSGT